jgi:hypothetical protein
MNDLYYIKYNPELMLCDTMDMSAATELAHRRLSDFIWRQSKAYRFNEALLIHFTKCTIESWPEVWAGLQEKGWRVSGDYVVHAGVIESHNAAQIEYADECNATAKATAAKTGVLRNSLCVTDDVTGIVTINVTTHVTRDVANDVSEDVTRTQSESKSKLKQEPPKTSIISQTSQSTPKPSGTRLTFSMLARVALEIKENKTGWHYDNHKLNPDLLVTAGLVSTLRPFVDRISERQARESWAEAAVKTHQAAVDGMNITHSLAHYAIGIWRDELSRLATPVSE